VSATAPAIDRLCRHAATLLVRAQDGPADEYGNPGWSELEQPTTVELQQAGAREELDGAVQVSTWRVWLPADAPTRGWDGLRVESGPLAGVYEVSGDAWQVVNPRTGVLHHVEAFATRTA
jgi:hypothetical protein